MPRREDNEGSVYYDAGRDRWVAAVSLPNKRRVIKRTRTEPEARDALREMRRRYILGTLVPPSDTTLTDWYVQVRDSRDLRPASLQVYGLSVAKLVAEIGPVRVDRLSPEWITACITTLRDRGMGSRNLQLAYMFLGSVLGAAVKAKLVPDSPMRFVERPSHTPRARTYWTLAEAQAFLAACETSRHQWAPLFIVMTTCGLRLAEAAGLTWGRVDLRARTITIDQSNVRLNDGLHSGPPKTPSSVRTLSVPSPALRALKVLHARAGAPLSTEPVFASGAGTVLLPQTVRRALYQMCDRVGVPRTHPHGLRHVAGALAFRATHDILAVQKRLGHARASVTMDVYAYLMSDDERTSAALDHVLGEPDPDTAPIEDHPLLHRATKLARESQDSVRYDAQS